MRYANKPTPTALHWPRFPMMAALTGACLLTFSACSSNPAKVERDLPPLPMLEPRPLPALTGENWRDLVRHAIRLREAAQAAEADKAAARAALGIEAGANVQP